MFISYVKLLLLKKKNETITKYTQIIYKHIYFFQYKSYTTKNIHYIVYIYTTLQIN